MSKQAEEAALKAYPKEDRKVWHSAFGAVEFDKNAESRKAYQEGYEQAEKDLALTGEDIRNISKILHQLEAEDWCSELIFDEAARIFNEQREKKS